MSTIKGWIFALSMALTAAASVLTHTTERDRETESGHRVTAGHTAAAGAADTGWG
ncbi:hypothetical protein ACWEQO_24920 [Streptomyces sp. NPDC004051]